MATEWGGYMGQILDVDLTTGQVGTYDVSDEDRERFLGGKTLAAKILWDELPPGADPLGPDNVMVFMTGPLTGSLAPCSSRFDLSTKNVLTGGIGTSNCGGDFGYRLKAAGWDGLIVRGQSKAPVRIDIDTDGARISDAAALWGKDTVESQEGLAKATAAAVIGPAGENLVRFASIACGERMLGRCGVGAVMGSKRLKLITATGKQKPPFHDADKLKAENKAWREILKAHKVTGEHLPTYGTAGLVQTTNATRVLPTHNFRQGHFDGAQTISGEEIVEKFDPKHKVCRFCGILCGHTVAHNGQRVKQPEFETIGMFGSSIENGSMENIIEWNDLCDRYGMDTISTGSTVACAMELQELGFLEGVELGVGFGSYGGMEALLRKIALREGVGAELAEGSLRFARRYGAPEYAMESKGLEFAAYEPRNAVGHGLGYATSNRGGCHINGGYMVYLEDLGEVTMDPHTTKAKPELTVFQQNLMEAISAAGNCIFTSYAIFPDMPSWYDPNGLGGAVANWALKASRFLLGGQGRWRPDALLLSMKPSLIPHTRVLAALTGMNMTLGHFLAVGERGFTLERLFNLREGLTAADDTLPPRLTEQPQDPDMPESRVPLTEMLPRYYKVRDWDPAGVPSERLLKLLGLDFAEPVAARLRAEPDAKRRDYLAARAAEESTMTEHLDGRPGA